MGSFDKDVSVVLDWEDFKRPFTKSDLQNGDFLVRRNGSVEMLINGVCVSKYGYNLLEHLNEDLSAYSYNIWDVVQVYRPREKSQYTFNNYIHGDLMFERKDKDKKCEMKITKLEFSID